MHKARVSAPLVKTGGGKMKLYRNSIGWPFFQLGASLLAATGSSACYRPRQGVEAQRQILSPSKRQETWGVGGICYLEDI